RRPRESRRWAAALVAQRPAALALLPGAFGRWGVAAARVGPGRRDHHRAEGCARVRRASASAAPGREPDPAAGGGDPRRVRRLRPARLEGCAGLEGAAREASARARAEGEEVLALPGLAGPQAGREVARAAGAGGARRPNGHAAGCPARRTAEAGYRRGAAEPKSAL